MKVSFLLPHLRISGGTRIALTYASELAKRGHEVTVYVQSTHVFRRTIANIFGLGRPGWIPGFSARVKRVPALAANYVDDSDAIVATSYQSVVALDSLPKTKGRHYYLVQHDEGLYHGPREKVDETYRMAAQKIVVSSWLRDVMRTYGQNAILLLNPLDARQFRQVPRTASSKTTRILLLHHTYDWKGTKEGVAIVERIKKAHPEVRLIGFGVRSKNAAELPYDEYHFDVPQDALAALYSNVDIYLCPSWDEGFGLPSVEAMACGAALATYDNGGSRDYAFDGKTALVAKRRNTEDLFQKTEQLIADPELRMRIAKAGQKYVSTLPDWATQTKKLEEILAS